MMVMVVNGIGIMPNIPDQEGSASQFISRNELVRLAPRPDVEDVALMKPGSSVVPGAAVDHDRALKVHGCFYKLGVLFMGLLIARMGGNPRSDP